MSKKITEKDIERLFRKMEKYGAVGPKYILFSEATARRIMRLKKKYKIRTDNRVPRGRVYIQSI